MACSCGVCQECNWAQSHEYEVDTEQRLHNLQLAVAQHIKYLSCYIDWKPVPKEWIAANDSGSLADALVESGWPHDEYGNLDLSEITNGS